MAHRTTIQEVVEYGIEDVDEDREIKVPLGDLLFVYKTFGELIRFFQDPSHYPDVDAVAEFIGNTEEGALSVCWEAQQERLLEALPDDVTASIEAGELDHPELPEYGRRAEAADEDDFDDEFDDDDLGAHGFEEEYGDDDDDLAGLFEGLDFDD